MRRARLEVLAESAAQPGFVRAAARFVAELGRCDGSSPRASRRRPARLGGRWPAPPAYAERSRRSTARYREGLEAAGLVDAGAVRRGAPRRAATATRALGRRRRCSSTASTTSTRSSSTRSRRCREQLRRGRDRLAALRARHGWRSRRSAGVHQELLAIGARRARAAARSTTTTRTSRAPRSTTSSGGCSRTRPTTVVEPGHAVSFHSAGGERAEVELAAARVLELLRDGVAPGDVAVVFRDPTHYSSLLEQVFGAYGIPYSIDRTLPFGHTGLGRGLLALIRARRRRRARPRTCSPTCARPACCACRASRTRLEAEVRREGARARRRRACALGARPLAARGARPARARPRHGCLRRRAREPPGQRLFAAPYRRTRHRPAAARSSRRRARSPRPQEALAELRAVLGDEARRPRARAARAGAARGARGRDAAAGPRAGGGTRRRSARAASRWCSAAGSRRASSRAAPRPSRSSRTTTAARSPPRAASCCRCARTGSTASATCSTSARRAPSGCSCSARARATRRATRRPSRTSWTTCASCSPDGAELRTRSLSEVTWRPEDAPTAAEWDRALAATGPRRAGAAGRPAQLGAAAGGAVRAATPLPARALENFADCPVKWLVEDLLQAARSSCRTRGDGARLLRPRGAQPHLSSGCARRPASRRVTHGNLADAERILLEELRDQQLDVPALAEADARAGGHAPARVRPPALPALARPTPTRSFEPVELERDFGDGRVRAGRARGRPAGARPDRPRGRARRHGARDRLQDRQARGPLQGRRAGSRRTASRPRSTCWSSRSCSGCARPAASTWRSAATTRARAAWSREDVDELGRALGRHATACRRRSSRRSSTGRSGGSARPTPRCAAASCAARPDRCDWNGGCKYPSVCRSER